MTNIGMIFWFVFFFFILELLFILFIFILFYLFLSFIEQFLQDYKLYDVAQKFFEKGRVAGIALEGSDSISATECLHGLAAIASFKGYFYFLFSFSFFFQNL